MHMVKQDPWKLEKDFPRFGIKSEQLKFLVRYAILAPSSHNTQPRKFRIAGDRIRIFVDQSRWLQVADADRRELHVSVGAALENLLVAAEHFAFSGKVSYFPGGTEPHFAAEVHLSDRGDASDFRPPELFDAIQKRHTNHHGYDGRPLSGKQIQRLESVSVEAAVKVYLSDEPALRRKVDELVVRANALQFSDPAWREELGLWLGQGVFGTGWIMSTAAQLAVTYLNMTKSVSKKDSEPLQSASALGVVTAARPDRAAQVQVGQAFERLFLTATVLGLQLQPMNQVLQLPDIKASFKELLPHKWAMRKSSSESVTLSPIGTHPVGRWSRWLNSAQDARVDVRRQQSICKTDHVVTVST
jgi:hypothetical protein